MSKSEAKLVFARDYTDWAGKEHKADSSAELDEGERDHVLRLGYARLEESKSTASNKE